MNTLSLHDRTVGEIAAEMPVSIRIFEAWKIDYCCGGHTPLPDACAEAGKSIDEFTIALEGAATVPQTDENAWTAAPLQNVSAQIVELYHRYTREELETLATLAARVEGVHGHRRPELADVSALVRKLTDDLIPHMLKEEQILFPYVDQLERAAGGEVPAPTPFFGTVKNPVRMMMMEHDAVGELLAELRGLTDDYTPPEGACFSYRELYRRFTDFEQRTHEHIHVENNVYFPRAVALEDRVSDATGREPRGTSCCGGHH